MKRLAATAPVIAVFFFLLTACTPAGSRTEIDSQGIPAVRHQPAIVVVHDPGHVTGTLSGPCRFRGQLPDPACTPGAIDPAVTQAGISSTICIRGYTATVRPPAAETELFKHSVAYPAYGFANVPGGASELDHLIPLELGGANDASNLWPEPGAIPNAKDKVENALRAAVCDHRATLKAAQDAIASDWTTAEQRLGL